jgi:ATP-binding cassette subfamily F protein 3
MLKLSNITKAFNGKKVLEDVSFILNDGEKLGLIGRNGAGKSTVLRIIAGKVSYDSGSFQTSRNYRIGYLEQHLDFSTKTLLEETCKALPLYKQDYYWEAEKVLAALNFSPEDFSKNPTEFSGGWQMRICLAKLLLQEPDLLLLDEPTNYLDILSIRWLKVFLRQWSKSLILITHDKKFMDDIVNYILIIHRNVSKKIKGTVDDMYRQLEKEEAIYEKTRFNEDKKRAQIQKYIDRFRYKATLATQVQSKIKMISKQEKKEKLSTLKNLNFDFSFQKIITNKAMVEVDHLEFSYTSSICLLKNLSFSLHCRDRVGIVGKNGLGKSTLLKLLAKKLQPRKGNIIINEKVTLGHFDAADIIKLSANNTLEEELTSAEPFLPKYKVLSVAGLMMFEDIQHCQKISVFSGGEKARILLGKIILKPCNLLLLDEPTSHFDLESSDALAESLINFPGASVTVSHNESFLQKVVNRLIVFSAKKVFVFEGTYNEFLTEVGYEEEK